MCESGETCKTGLGQSKVNVPTIPFNSCSKVCFLQVQSPYLIATPRNLLDVTVVAVLGDLYKSQLEQRLLVYMTLINPLKPKLV
jgi:hypothetical protein